MAIIPDSGKDLCLGDIYKPFLTDAEPSAILRVLSYDKFERPLGKKISSPSRSLDIYRDNQMLIMCFHFARNVDSFPCKTSVIFDCGARLANVYFESAENTVQSQLLQRPILQLFTTIIILQEQGMTLHACGINDNGRGMVFTGPSGSGKSTLADLWRAKNGVTILNDDFLIVRKINDQFWMYGTPWSRKAYASSSNKCVLNGIFLIRHAKQNIIVARKDVNAVVALLLQSSPPFWDPIDMQFTMNFIVDLSLNVPCYELGFIPNESVVDFVRGTT